MRNFWVLAMAIGLALAAPAGAADPIKVLIIDGQNNHDWKSTTPVLKKWLEDSGLFKVTVATTGKDLKEFKPKFSDYKVVVSNYNGALWPKETREEFAKFVKDGGGFVCVHAANNSFPDWPEYNEMIGLGGWGGRNEKSGPYLRIRDGKVVLDKTPGTGGSHGEMHEFIVETRDAKHPIMDGLPAKWLHIRDELYDRLRGPAKNVTLLATSYSNKKKGGTGEHEPMIFTVKYGKGKVFHTPMGHDAVAMRCLGFGTVLVRGTEWAATGKVTQKAPKDFPTEEKARIKKADK
jgi:type 1 glutamine amidotransferase